MSDAYIEQHDGVYSFAGEPRVSRFDCLRLSLRSIGGGDCAGVWGSEPGAGVRRHTYYLAHRDDVDRYLQRRKQDFDAARQAARDADPMFYQKLTDAKKQTPLTR